MRRSLVSSYDDYITYEPSLSAVTAPLWIAPLLLLAIGGPITSSSLKGGRP